MAAELLDASAVDAGVQAVLNAYPHVQWEGDEPERDVRLVLAAAQPLIEAAERERCIKIVRDEAALLNVRDWHIPRGANYA